ncbi:hypothetical protein VP01_1481g1 [Puccinia sorghi]|uniref:Uncharacterized protein n=1 Tax=Puccinia sorghi TaxID=27349 RepID=A0A0L6VLD7_9BASI|nr:hypothetical protein VP01_1481g1 [Puccinia sorghi]
MSFGLTNSPLSAANGDVDDHQYNSNQHSSNLHHHHQQLQQQQQQQQQHSYQPDVFQSDMNCSNPNQLPLDPPPPLITYEFQVPINLFSHQSLPSFSPGSASSCRSSSSSSHSLFNSSHHHVSSSIQDNNHPTPLHLSSYLTSTLDLGTSSKFDYSTV